MREREREALVSVGRAAAASGGGGEARCFEFRLVGAGVGFEFGPRCGQVRAFFKKGKTVRFELEFVVSLYNKEKLLLLVFEPSEDEDEN